MALEIRSIDMMHLTKDLLDNPASQAETDNHIDALCRDYPTLTHIGISVPMNTNAQALAARGSNFAIQPATYAAQFINKIHAKGKRVLFRGTDCAFEGLYSFTKTNKVNGTLANWESTPDSWLARCATWIGDNIALFINGDLISPFPEAVSHWPLTNGGTINQFFLDLAVVLEQIGVDAGKAIDSKHFSHIWTSAIQQAYNAQYTEFGVATYDHYGVSIGLNKRFQSYGHGSVGDSNTYTVPTSITENATNRHDFYPEKLAYNETIDVYVVNKGTGDWTMTIHDGANNPTQMCDHTDFTSKFNSYQVTIPNASLTNGAMNTFTIVWDNPAPDVLYHFHLTSTVADGTVKTTTANDLNTAYSAGYKCTALADAYEIDIRKTYARTGVPQFIQEWGDYWSLDASRSDPVRTQAQHEAYLDSIYAAIQRLANEGIVTGFQYWRSGDGSSTESIMYNAGSGGTFNYQMKYAGQRLKRFFDANGTPQPFVVLR